jgi:hypothetical protein
MQNIVFHIKPTHNSTYKKLAILCLNETLYFVSSSVLADSFRLRIRQLLVAAIRYGQVKNDTACAKMQIKDKD